MVDMLAVSTAAILASTLLVVGGYLLVAVFSPTRWAFDAGIASPSALDSMRLIETRTVFDLTFPTWGVFGGILVTASLSLVLWTFKRVSRLDGKWLKPMVLEIIVLFALGLVIGLSITPAFATASSTQVATGGPFQQEKPCSYYVFTDGSNYYAQDCNTGVIAYGGPSDMGGISGNDAAGVVNQAASMLESTGGEIDLGTGIYAITSSIVIYPQVRLSGVGLISAYNEFPGPGGAVIQAMPSLNAPAIEVVNGSQSSYTFGEISDLVIRTNGHAGGTNQDGIYITDSAGVIKDYTIENVGVFGMGGNCFNLNSAAKQTWSEIYAEGCTLSGVYDQKDLFHWSWNSGYIFGNGNYGIQLASGAGGIDGNGITIANNVKGGIYSELARSENEFFGGTMRDNGGSSNPDVYLSQTMPGGFFRFSGVDFIEDRASGASNYAVYENSKGTQASFSGCEFYGIWGISAVKVAPGTSMIFSSNLNFNPVGELMSSWATNGLHSGDYYLGLGGNSTTLVAGKFYVADGVDLIVNSSGGSPIITVADPAGKVIFTASSLSGYYLPVGYQVSWSTLSGVTVTVFGD
jgi:hypothetical protein